MTENKMTVRFYKKTSAQLAYVEKLWENNPMLVDKMPGTRNAFIQFQREYPHFHKWGMNRPCEAR